MSNTREQVGQCEIAIDEQKVILYIPNRLFGKAGNDQIEKTCLDVYRVAHKGYADYEAQPSWFQTGCFNFSIEVPNRLFAQAYVEMLEKKLECPEEGVVIKEFMEEEQPLVVSVKAVMGFLVLILPLTYWMFEMKIDPYYAVLWAVIGVGIFLGFFLFLQEKLFRKGYLVQREFCNISEGDFFYRTARVKAEVLKQERISYVHPSNIAFLLRCLSILLNKYLILEKKYDLAKVNLAQLRLTIAELSYKADVEDPLVAELPIHRMFFARHVSKGWDRLLKKLTDKIPKPEKV